MSDQIEKGAGQHGAARQEAGSVAGAIENGARPVLADVLQHLGPHGRAHAFGHRRQLLVGERHHHGAQLVRQPLLVLRLVLLGMLAR